MNTKTALHVSSKKKRLHLMYSSEGEKPHSFHKSLSQTTLAVMTLRIICVVKSLFWREQTELRTCT